MLTYIDRFLLLQLSTAAQVGLYSLAYNVSMVLNLFCASINTAWAPIYYDLADTPEGRAKLPRLTTVYASVVTALAIGYTLVAPDLLLVLANQRFHAAVSVVPVVAAGYYFFALYMVVSTPIFHRKKTMWAPIISGSRGGDQRGREPRADPAVRHVRRGLGDARRLPLHVPDRARALRSGSTRASTRTATWSVLIATYGISLAASIGLIEVHLPIVIDLLIKAALLPVLIGILILFKVTTIAEMRGALRRPRRRARFPRATRPSSRHARPKRSAASTDDTGFSPDNRPLTGAPAHRERGSWTTPRARSYSTCTGATGAAAPRRQARPATRTGSDMDLAGKRVLVTGADGFIGSHLSEALVAAGAQVRALALYNSFGTWGWLDTLPPDTLAALEVVSGDVRDPYGVRAAVRGVDVVFHLAALIAIPYSYHAPDSYVATNVQGTLNVLQAVRDLGVARLLVTSTSEVFGTARYVPIDEGHPRQGQSPYSATKIAADALAESFYRSFATPVTVVPALQHLRPAPVGPRGDPHDHRPARRRPPRDPPRRPASDPRPHLRRRHLRRLSRPGRLRRRGGPRRQHGQRARDLHRRSRAPPDRPHGPAGARSSATTSACDPPAPRSSVCWPTARSWPSSPAGIPP